MKKLMLAATLMAGLAVPGYAMAGSNIAGAGFTMCHDFKDAVADGPTHTVVVSWILGFFSGMNAVNDATDKPQHDLSELGTDEKANAIIDEVIAKCADEPDSAVVNHIYPIYETLPPYQK
nr:hypothetical protein [uncultured Gellertiella sp.]